MHIAIDATPLESGHKGRGVGIYTKNLIEALNKYENQYSYTLFTRRQNIPINANIVHYPYFDPFFITLPLFKVKPTVVTVHDLIPLVFPDKFPAGIRGSMRWYAQKISLLGARRVIADSNTSKDDIARITNFPKNKIDTIYLAPDDEFTTKDSGESSVHIKNKFSLSAQYIVVVSDVNWNKNINGLLEAFALVSRKYPHIQLVLVGKSFLNTSVPETIEINKTAVRLNINHALVRTGYVTNDEIAFLYKHAACLVQPSFYEGFGLPVLEAFASGCPVVSSDSSSLREIAGPGILVQSHDYSSIASGIITALTLTDSKREILKERGYAWVKKFTWEKVAHETVKSYRSALQ